MKKLDIILELERDKNQSDRAISKRVNCHLTYVQKVRQELFGNRRYFMPNEMQKLEIAYRELSKADQVIEYLVGEMEFNITHKTLTRECARHFGIRISSVEHVFNCWLPAKEKNRWRLAMNKKRRDVRIKK